VKSFDSGPPGPLIRKCAIGADKKSAQYRAGSAIALGGMVTGHVVNIAEKKAAKVEAGALAGIKGGHRNKPAAAYQGNTDRPAIPLGCYWELAIMARFHPDIFSHRVYLPSALGQNVTICKPWALI
jgi:hypothetical protein